MSKIVSRELAPDWSAATWEGARQRQLRRQAMVASPAQRLRWLEEALELVFRSAARDSSKAAETTETRGDARGPAVSPR